MCLFFDCLVGDVCAWLIVCSFDGAGWFLCVFVSLFDCLLFSLLLWFVDFLCLFDELMSFPDI